MSRRQLAVCHKHLLLTWCEVLGGIEIKKKPQQKKTIFDLWLACYTQEEIAERVGMPRKTMADYLENFGEKRKLSISAKIKFQDDSFTPPIYNVWKLQNKTSGISHFGNSEQRWLENLL